MIKIKIKDGESIDKALKRYKRKVSQTGIMNELRERKQFTKRSVLKRKAKLKAKYIQKTYRDLDNK